MRTLFAAAVLLMVAACGAYQFPGGSTPGTGSASGRVLAVPCAPVEQAGKQCPGRPLSGLAIIFSNGNAIITAQTNSNGYYFASLASGTWKVTFRSYMRIISGPATLTIAAGSETTADYIVDSGIRVPVPQQ